MQKRKSINHTVRTKDGKILEIKNYTRSTAMKLMCTECMGWNGSEVKDCKDNLCPLFPFKRVSQKAYYGK